MQKAKFKRISTVIVISILITLVTQGYWNYRNFELNKQRFLNDMQAALDNGVEGYYANLAKFQMVNVAAIAPDTLADAFTVKMSFDDEDTFMIDYQSFSHDSISGTHVFSSVMTADAGSVVHSGTGVSAVKKVITIDSAFDINSGSGFTDLASKIVIALSNDTVNTREVASHIEEELTKRNLPSEFKLLLQPFVDRELRPIDAPNVLVANEAYLPPGMSLRMGFGNHTWKILQMGFMSLLLSILMAAAIIWGLLYLYRVIQNQRQLSELKNDLINNLTHEFKTPIATISTALEGIDKFNETNDLEKTHKYIGIGQDQLRKLDLMVEKLLETATLEKDEIVLNKESIDLSEALSQIVEKFKMTTEKTIEASIQSGVVTRIDPVHIDNALTNLIDNAIKYGGDQIRVNLTAGEKLVVEVQDNGPGIPKRHLDKLFEKFYRVPQGDQHDVKGYGIGLYYTEKIIQKHGGDIRLTSKPGATTFTITLP